MQTNRTLLLTALMAAIALLLSTTLLTGSALAAGVFKLGSVAAAQTPTDDDDDDDDGGTGCAAAYLLGDNDPRLDTLRQFRDDVLAKSAVGQKLIQVYYANSTAVIAALEENPQLKKTAQAALAAIIDQNVTISSVAAAQTPTDDDDDDDDGGTGCAAAYLLGDNDPRLDTLRQFRDDVLAKSAVGQKLIQIYYANSAAIIAALEQNPQLKKTAANVLAFIAG